MIRGGDWELVEERTCAVYSYSIFKVTEIDGVVSWRGIIFCSNKKEFKQTSTTIDHCRISLIQLAIQQ